MQSFCTKSSQQPVLQKKDIPQQSLMNTTSGIGGDDLIWSDEFNGSGGFDVTKWSHCIRKVSPWNMYLTSTSNYAYQNDTNLVLKMDNAVIPGDNVPYHTGGIETRDKFNFKYGMIEARMKYDEGNGAWPAFWMMPQFNTYGGWPRSGEIDICEHFNTTTTTQQNVFTYKQHLINQKAIIYSAPYIQNAYNVYTLLWTENSLRFFVNGKFTTSYNKAPGDTWEAWPYDQPMYIIFNQSCTDTWWYIDLNKLPFHNRVDYVRVYQASHIYNAGFEYGNALTPWTAWSANQTGAVSVVNNNAHSGTNALSLSGGEKSAEQLVTSLKPNTTYVLKAYAKLGTGTGASVGVKNYGGTTVGSAVTSNTYTQQQITFTTGATNTSALIYFYKNSVNGTAYADDFSLEEL